MALLLLIFSASTIFVLGFVAGVTYCGRRP